MALKFKRGAVVRQVVKPIEGAIVGMRVVDDDVQYEVTWQDPDDKTGKSMHSRFFSGDDLEAVEQEGAAEEAASAVATTSAEVVKKK